MARTALHGSASPYNAFLAGWVPLCQPRVPVAVVPVATATTLAFNSLTRYPFYMIYASFLCLVLLVALAVTGERILPLYGGDTDLAARGSKASFALLAGCAFAFAQPVIWTWFAGVLQRLISAEATHSAIATTLHNPGFRTWVQTAATVMCWMIVIATGYLALQLWRGRF